jgi:hypothetical protein
MDYLGIKDNEHWFECKACGARESTLDPEKPTTPVEKPRKGMREFGSSTVIGKNIYGKK